MVNDEMVAEHRDAQASSIRNDTVGAELKLDYGADALTMISKGSTGYQTTYDLLREMLRGTLRTVVESGPRTGVDSVPWRACAALYSLLEAHPVDHRGRCRSCRRPGALLGRVRRRCQVRVAACYRLHQFDERLLQDQLARELSQHHPGTPTPQSPAVPHPPFPGGDSPQAGRPAPDHDEAATGRPRRLTGPDLPEAFRRLAEAELTELLEPDHPGELHRVVILPGGQSRYHELNAKQSPTQSTEQPPVRSPTYWQASSDPA